MTATVGEFVAAAAAANVSETIPNARVRAPARTRVYRSLTVIRNAAATAWADLRSAWWMPDSIPTISRAWAERNPDMDRVPGGSPALYTAWRIYSHTVGLAVPALAAAVVGALTPLVWAARHPARLAVTVIVAIALAAIWI